MALLNFPSSPTNGQFYPVTPLPGQNQYQWSAAEQTWRLLGTATAVTPGTYGDATNVGQFTVDAQGRVTFAQNIPIAGGGTVTDVTATTPLASSGGITPNISLTGLVPIANGGTNASTVSGAQANLLPAQTGNAGKVLATDGAGVLSWTAIGGSGTVTSVGIIGTSGIGVVSGSPVTSSGSITLAIDIATLPVLP